MANDARAELLAFLDEHAFDPVLRMAPERADRREEFEDAQCHTERVRRDLHACDSAAAVYVRFMAELQAERGRWVEREVDRLGLPTLRGIERAFGDLCVRLGVRQENEQTRPLCQLL